MTYKYSFGRKAFFTTLGLATIFLGLLIASRVDINPKLFKTFVWGVVTIITGYGLENAGISIASMIGKNKNGG